MVGEPHFRLVHDNIQAERLHSMSDDTQETPGTAVQATVSGLAMALIEEQRRAGHDIHIPSLGITIPGTAQTHTAIVHAIAALPQDDADREQVLHDLRSACDSDDYDAARWAGALGMVEL